MNDSLETTLPIVNDGVDPKARPIQDLTQEMLNGKVQFPFKAPPPIQVKPEAQRLYITRTGEIVDYATPAEGYAAAFDNLGRGVGHEMGLGITSPVGALADNSRDRFFYDWESNLPANLASQDPGWSPIPKDDTVLASTTGADFYTKHIPSRTKEFLNQFGVGPKDFESLNGLQAKSALAEKLWYAWVDDNEARYSQEAGFLSKAGRFLTVDLLANAALDPWTYITVGTSAVVKGVGGAVAKASLKSAAKTAAAKNTASLFKAAGTTLPREIVEAKLPEGVVNLLSKKIYERSFEAAVFQVGDYAKHVAYDAKTDYAQNSWDVGAYFQTLAGNVVLPYAIDIGVDGLKLGWKQAKSAMAIRDSLAAATKDEVKFLSPRDPSGLTSLQDFGGIREVQAKYESIGQAMQAHKKDIFAYEDLLNERALASMEKAGITKDDIIDVVSKNPTDIELREWLETAITYSDRINKMTAAAGDLNAPVDHIPPEALSTVWVGKKKKVEVAGPVPDGAKPETVEVDNRTVVGFNDDIDRLMYGLAYDRMPIDRRAQVVRYLKSHPELSGLNDAELSSLIAVTASKIKAQINSNKIKATGEAITPRMEIDHVWRSITENDLQSTKVTSKVAEKTMTPEALKSKLGSMRTKFEKASKDVEALRNARKVAVAAGDTDLAGKISKKLKDVYGVIDEVTADNQGALTEMPVKDATPGTKVDDAEAFKQLDLINSKGEIFGGRGTDVRYVGPIPAPVKKGVKKLVSNLTGTAADLYDHAIKGVAQWANLIDHGPTKRTPNGDRVLSSAQQAHNMATNRGGTAVVYMQDVFDRHGLSPSEMAEANKAIAKARISGEDVVHSSKKVEAAAKEAKSILDTYLEGERQRGREVGLINEGVENYYPTYIDRQYFNQLDEIADHMHKKWVDEWSKPDAELHNATLYELGWMKADGTWNEIRHTDFDAMKFIADETGKRNLTVSDLERFGKKYLDAYLAMLAKRPVKPGEVGGALYQQAHNAIRKKTGTYVVPDTTKVSNPFLSDLFSGGRSQRQVSEAAKRIEEGAWADPNLFQYLITDHQYVLNQYATSFPLEAELQGIANDITGRWGITFDQVGKWLENLSLRSVTDATSREEVKQAFRAINEKLDFLRRTPQVGDNGVLGMYDFTTGAALGVRRIGVTSVGATQQFVSEPLLMLMLGGASPNQMRAWFSSIIEGLTTRDARHLLVGMGPLRDTFYHQVQRGIVDHPSTISQARNWWQRTFSVPWEQVKQAAKGDLPLSKKAGNVVLSAIDMGNSITAGLTGEWRMNAAMKRTSREMTIAKIVDHWEKMQKASDGISKLAKNYTEDELDAVFRHSGLGADFGRRLMEEGVLSKDVMAALKFLNSMDDNFISKYSYNKTLKIETSSQLLDRISDPVVKQKARNAYQRVVNAIEREADMLSPRPGVFDQYTGPRTSTSRLFQAFTVWSNAFFNKTMVDKFGNAEWYKAYAGLGMVLFSEFLFTQLYKYAYGGMSLQDLQDEWDENPQMVMAQSLSMTNTMSSLGSMGRLVMGLTGMNPVVGAKGVGGDRTIPLASDLAMSTGRIMKAWWDGDKDVNPRDLRNALKRTPVMNTPQMQMLGKFFGYKSLAGMLLGDREN